MAIADLIREAGVVGCGGAGFPTHAKLKGPIEYYIVNGAEGEPLLRTDRYIMAKIFLGRDIDYYLLPDDAAVTEKGLELVKEDRYDLIVVYNQEYDDMTGSALAETVFSWPGIGLLIVQSIAKRDTPMVTGSIILCCILMALINLLVDIIYAYCDPRIKAQYSRKG